MNRWMVRTMASLALVAFVAGTALAAPPKKGHKKPMAKPAVCAACHMKLSMKRSAMTPRAVRLRKGGPIMYCCAACKMPASMVVKSAGHKKAMKHKMGKMAMKGKMAK